MLIIDIDVYLKDGDVYQRTMKKNLLDFMEWTARAKERGYIFDFRGRDVMVDSYEHDRYFIIKEVN